MPMISEFLLALEVRFASREKAVLGQLEVGCSLFPDGGGLERLPKLIGRARPIRFPPGRFRPTGDCDDQTDS